MLKGHKSQFEEIAKGKSWDQLSNKIENNSIELYLHLF